MRVISGSAKGRHLTPLKDVLIRPTSDKTKEAIFDILSNLGGIAQRPFPFSNFLDIFAGTGALGIEALSRGALKGVFIESNIKALRVLENNLKICNLLDRAKVMPVETFKAISILKREKGIFSLVFVDPPYDSSLVADTIKRVLDNKLLAHKGVVVAEHSIRKIPSERLGGLILKDRRRYGRTMVSFYLFNAVCGQS